MKKLIVLTTASALALGVSIASQAATTVVFTDSFEAPLTSNWKVYGSVGDDSDNQWVLDDGGAGIEIQTNSTVGNADAYDGDQYVELDSDNRNGGVAGDKNSSMTRVVSNLGSGTYQLNWFYQPRTNTLGDNTITAFAAFSDDGNTFVDQTQIGLSDEAGPGGWTQYSSSVINLDAITTLALTFQASGTRESFGGFIDLVTLTRTGDFMPGNPRVGEVPLPAAAWLFLSVIGAGGLLRRKARQS